MMGKVTGFKEFDRKTEDYRPVELRLKDYGEIFTGTHNIGHLQEQGARCMDCGVPWLGCSTPIHRNLRKVQGKLGL
jgi:glutamate synthase (NADPH/NADH) small chain